MLTMNDYNANVKSMHEQMPTHPTAQILMIAVSLVVIACLPNDVAGFMEPITVMLSKPIHSRFRS